MRLSIKNTEGVVAIDEVRCAPTALWLTDWASVERAIAIVIYTLRIGPRSVSSEKVKALAIVGQHALARRFERGLDRGNVAVMRDLIPIVTAWPTLIRQPGNFEVETGSGTWRGEVVPLVLNGEAMTVMNVRTFVD